MHIELARRNTFLAVMEKKAENLANGGFFLTEMQCLWCHLKLNIFINCGKYLKKRHEKLKPDCIL